MAGLGRIVAVANPEHRRAAFLQEALRKRGWPPAVVFPWSDIALRLDELDDALGRGSLVRLESPGQNSDVERQFLALGASQPEELHLRCRAISAEGVTRLACERGRILYPRQWYRGFRAILGMLRNRFAGQDGVRWLNAPAEVAVLFDKAQCQSRLGERGIPVPQALPGADGFDGLMEILKAAGRPRVFVKLKCGSSASGAVAFAVSGARMLAITTVEMVRREGTVALYNSRRLRRYESLPEIADLFDALCAEGVQVEEWIPKATLGGEACDLRVLAIGGRVRHTVLRQSRSPMTNLHLLNRRGDPEELRERVGPEKWDLAMADCRRVAEAFPGSHHLGIDLLFSRDLSRHAVVEANAFGDLLTGCLWNGLTTHEAELADLEEAPP